MVGVGTCGSANPNFYDEDLLFRIDRDRKERKNLINDPESRSSLQPLRSLLVQQIQTTGRVETQPRLVRKMKIRRKKVTLPD